MGNQIKFSPNGKDKSLTGDNDEYHALEIKYIQLKNTNRKLISRLNQQKQLFKNLNLELESIRNNKDLINFNEFKKEYQTLKKKNDDLEKLLIQSQKENRNLKNEIKKLNDEPIKDSKNSRPWDKLKKLRN